MKKDRVVSGVKPTGRPHLGNYFGAMKPFIEMQETSDLFVFIADYHALIDVRDPDLLATYIREIIIDYLALGLSPKKATIFQQSDIHEHTELAWIFECLMPLAELERAHAYKDAKAKNEKITGGLFGYPVLMAADILLYDAVHVPVGADQKQHIETAQLLARKFNAAYGETFVVPEARITTEVATVPGLDGRKMSKSYGNTIEIFEPTESLRKKIMSIKTDSTPVGQPIDPDKDISFQLHKLVTKDIEELRGRYSAGKITYKESKEMLFHNMEAFIAPLRKERAKIADNVRLVNKVLVKGAKVAQKAASKKMEAVRLKIGVARG